MLIVIVLIILIASPSSLAIWLLLANLWNSYYDSEIDRLRHEEVIDEIRETRREIKSLKRYSKPKKIQARRAIKDSRGNVLIEEVIVNPGEVIDLDDDDLYED